MVALMMSATVCHSLFVIYHSANFQSCDAKESKTDLHLLEDCLRLFLKNTLQMRGTLKLLLGGAGTEAGGVQAAEQQAVVRGYGRRVSPGEPVVLPGPPRSSAVAPIRIPSRIAILQKNAPISFLSAKIG